MRDRQYPGVFSSLSGPSTSYGYGTALIDFAKWLEESHRLGPPGSDIPSDPGIRWWRLTDGALALGIQAAHRALNEGYTTSDDPAVQAWINYGLGNLTGGFGEQSSLWFAHQLSIHSLMQSQGSRSDLAGAGYEAMTEVNLMQDVVKNVDWAALNNVPTNTSDLGRLTQAFYPRTYPVGFGRMLFLSYFDLGNGVPNVGIFSTRWNE